jgi:iron complex outermembrane receptor protein
MNTRTTFTAVVVCSGALLAATALAQEGGLALEEIVVTAEKREATLQDTAISVTAFSGDMLRRMGVRDARDLAIHVPNLYIGSRRNEVLINVRGIQSNNTTEVGDPAVALHLDGVYLSRPRSAAALFHDVERIEVLRGPQGTLYGRNATAGNINIITNKPTNELDASGEILFGNYDRISARGMVNVPIIDDRLMMRAAVMSDNRDGYNDNDVQFGYIKNTDDADDLSIRLHTLVNFTDSLSALVTLKYHDTGGVGPNTSFVRLIEDPDDLRQFSFNTQPSIDVEVYGLTTEINWEFWNMALTYIGGWNVDDVKNRLQDADQTTRAFGPPTNTMAQFGPFSQYTYALSHELRLASTDADSRLRWLAALYYFDEVQDVWLNFNPVPGVQRLIFDQDDVSALSKAVFGEAKFDLTDQFELVGGIRYTEDEKARYGQTVTIANVFTIVGVSPNIGKVKSDSTDWRAGINWRPTDDWLYYFSASTGYKAGGFNDGIGAPYDPEEVMSYEGGAKTSFFERRLLLNGSVFYMDYTDLQVSATGVNPITGLPGLFTQNAGEATVWGLEIEGQALLSDAARVDFSLAYLDAEYDQYDTDDPSVPGTLIEDLSGNRLTKAPEWSFNIGAEYEFRLGEMGTLTPRVSFHFEDDQFLREFNKPVDHEDSFTRTDLVLTYRAPGERLYVEAFANNLEDEDVRNNLQNFPGHGLQYALDAPRTYGVRIGYEM